MPSSNQPPLIIVGAPRSGTNALRDALCKLPGFHTWPCDELNPLWRTRNREVPTDALCVEHARPEVVSTIRDAFDRRQRAEPASTVVEKTCANALRLDFVHKVIPEARYVNIVRDGRDAASSAAERWGAPFDLQYTLRKLRFVPTTDLLGVAVDHIRQRFSPSGPEAANTSTWGPRWEGMTAMLDRDASLEEVSSAQWLACIDASDDFFDRHADSLLSIRYESFVTDPADTLKEVCDFGERSPNQAAIESAAAGIHEKSVGRWKQTPLASDEAALDTLRPGLERHEYSDVD